MVGHLAAAFFIPALGVLGIAKPNFGLALAATSHRPRTVAWILPGLLDLWA
jgi:hypothetical protein